MAEHTALCIAQQSTISRPTRTRGTSKESADDGASNETLSRGDPIACRKLPGTVHVSLVPPGARRARKGPHRAQA
eukprot:scaffold124869_cov38-Attheya_sp.AAC.1